jgi:hypothetical protein
MRGEMIAGRGGPTALKVLHDRFMTMKTAADTYSTLLEASLDDIRAALELVQLQLARLMTGDLGDDTDDDEPAESGDGR